MSRVRGEGRTIEEPNPAAPGGGAHAQARIESSGGLLTVTLTRDDKLNAISPEITSVLWEALRRSQHDGSVRVLLIRAEGRYFTAGIDMYADTPSMVARDGAEFRALYRRHHQLYDELEALEKPVVLAAQGPCLGAGVEMALSCDFRLAAHSATFALPEVGLGTIPGSGGISRLTRTVGPHWAAWMAMAAQTVTSGQAHRIGLVHAVFPDHTFDEEARKFALHLASLPPQAVGLAKLTLAMAGATDRATARDIERLANTQLVLSDEFRRRREDWRNRRGRNEP